MIPPTERLEHNFPGDISYKNDGGAHRTLKGLKKRGFVPLRVLSLKRPKAGAFAVPFRVLGQKKSMTGDNVLF